MAASAWNPTRATGRATSTRRAPKVSPGYQFRSAAEWFAELYAAFHTERLNPKHPATTWLRKLKAQSLTG
jgi:hypothetical protein